MINKIHSKLIKLFPVALVACAVGMLASCSSSNQLASSFSKRKYSAGHFSNPVAKVKMDYKPAANPVAVSSIKPNNNLPNNTPLVENKRADKVPTFGTPVKSGNVSHINKRKLSSKQAVADIAKAPLFNQNNIVSLKEMTNSPAIMQSQGDGGGGSFLGGLDNYLRLCVIFLLIGLILLILGAILGSVFEFLAGIAFIVALIFFILWIVDNGSK